MQQAAHTFLVLFYHNLLTKKHIKMSCIDENTHVSHIHGLLLMLSLLAAIFSLHKMKINNRLLKWQGLFSELLT